MRVHVWTKHGWKTQPVNEEKKRQLTAVRSRIPYQQPEFDKFVTSKDLDLLDDVQRQIQVGLASDEMDALPNSLRQMIQASDVWHISNNKIFRIVDPITQAMDGEWGADNSEADIDVMSEGSSIRVLLEDSGIIPSIEEEYCDVMGELLETDNGELIGASPMVRVDMSVQYVGDDDEEDITGDYDSDDYVTQFRNPIPVVPHLTDEAVDNICHIRNEYIEQIMNADTDEEKEFLLASMDQKIDQVAGRELCVKLDSPLCGYKYTPPRRKHQFIITGQESHLTEAARQREKFFYDILSEATSCKSMEALYGPIVTETHVDPLTGELVTKNGRPGGFCGRIRSMYQHDRDLAREWSMGGEDSVFDRQRTEFLRRLRAENKDEETTRKSVFVWFDRIAGESTPVYRNGKLIKEGQKWKDSIWRQKRTEALKDLFMTKAQWNAVYKMINIQKERIKLNTETNENERKAIALLTKHFERITNLQDLRAYRIWAEKREFIWKAEYETYINKKGEKVEGKMLRKWNSYDFNRSLVEFLSTTNAARWWKSVVRKERYLHSRIAMFHKLNDNIISIEDTDMSEVSVACPYPKCEGMTIGVPKFAELQDGKGHLFVECDCGKKVWLIAYNESGSDIKTKEEAINVCNTTQ